MNDTLDRLKQIDAALTKLSVIRASNEHVAAGMTIRVGVGADGNNATHLEIGMASDGEAVLNALITSQAEAREWNVRQLQRQIREAQAYLDSGGGR